MGELPPVVTELRSKPQEGQNLPSFWTSVPHREQNIKNLAGECQKLRFPQRGVNDGDHYKACQPEDDRRVIMNVTTLV
jgi:hypothetical protein